MLNPQPYPDATGVLGHPLGWIAGLLLLAIAVQMCGCAGSQKIAVEHTPESSVQNEVTRFIPGVRAPKLQPLPSRGVKVSGAVEIREYRKEVEGAAPVEVYEMEADGDLITLRTPEREVSFRAPPRGETLTVRFDSLGQGYPEMYRAVIEGQPETERYEVEVPAARRSGGGMGIGRTIRWIAYGVIAAAVIWLLSLVSGAIKDARRDKQDRTMMEAIRMNFLSNFSKK